MDQPKIRFLTFKQHVRSRMMWKGSQVVSENKVWIRIANAPNASPPYIFKHVVACFSEALLKCFDEILVNAIDQYVNIVNNTNKEGGNVSEIKVSFIPKTGEIIITNNGQGMPVYVVQDEADEAKINGKYSVEGIISHEYSGSNFNEKTNPDQVTGGINGLGIKLINISSLRFEVETVDAIRQKFYSQVCENHMDIINPPRVVDLNNIAEARELSAPERAPHTTIRFIPDYAELCTSSTGVLDPNWLKLNATMFSKVLEFRLYETAAFISSIKYRYMDLRRIEYKHRVNIYYNDQQIAINDLTELMKMYPVEDCTAFEISQSRDEMNTLISSALEPTKCGVRFPWYICAGVNTAKKFEQLSIINGVHLEKGGSHTDLLLKQLLAKLQPSIDRLMSDSSIKITETIFQNLLFLMDCKQVPVPQFQGQTKESLKIGIKEINNMKEYYNIPDKAVNSIWKMLKPHLELLLTSQEKTIDKKKKKKIPIRKYEKAEERGPGSICFVQEGDSAAQMIRDIIYSHVYPFSSRKTGMYNIQGVPMNALKKIKKILIGGKTHIKRHAALTKNIGLQGLVEVFGLEYDQDYYFGPLEDEPNLEDLTDEDLAELRRRKARGDEAFAKLKYSKMIIATDQDLDGIGQICSLLVVFIMVFWPELIKRKFLWRLATPLIRAYHGEIVERFYSTDEFVQWVLSKFGGVEHIPKDWHIQYYKGLAGHTKEEVLYDIGANLEKNIYAFTLDDAAMASMELLYGKETAGRKTILITPVSHKYDADIKLTKEIACSEHFMIEAKAFQLDFMRRKLKSAIDGFIPSQRKAFAGARKHLRGANAEMKVYQLTGDIAKHMGYQHGDMSMNDTIIKMSQTWTGSNNIPPFVGLANGFGGRVDGRSETGKPRYINLCYNTTAMDCIFPREDDWILDYEYEDGAQCEPVFYVPIVPYAILESSTTAGVGWKISCWARNFWHVLRILRNMINFEYPMPAGNPSSLQGHVWLPKGMSVVVGHLQSGKVASEICLGQYQYNEKRNEIIITQLPLRVWSFPYCCHLKGVNPLNGKTEDADGEPLPKKALVKSLHDKTANDINHIVIQLRENAMSRIEDPESGYGNEYLDPIESYLEIHQQMIPQLNMFGADGCIKEFAVYEDIMREWFPHRQCLYELRINRQILLLQLKIKRLENILRFIDMDAAKTINIDKDFDDNERYAVLAAAGFQVFNNGLLKEPKYLKLPVLEQSILSAESGADYSYIDNITIRMKSKSGIATLRTKLDTLNSKLVALRQLTWKTLWLKELDDLVPIIKEGQRTDWLFGKKVKHIFRDGAST
jgi:DNA topoisomerase II